MKKIITLVATAAMLAVSCQKEAPTTDNTGNTSSSNTDSKLTATIVKTKVTYTETAGMDLQPAWEVGDKIIGFDDAGNTYTLTVASVSAETATLSGTVPDGTMHLIYKSGAKASDISNKTLAIDYTAQKGDKTMPAVMLADGTVKDGACEFAFTNAGAIIGISAVNGVPQGSTISKITVSGSNLSAATVALSGSNLALTATTVAADAISTAALSGIKVTDANGTLGKPVFIAVPAGAEIAKVIASIAKEPETMKKPSATPQEGVDYVTIGGVKWAKWNVGASSETDYGWYFHWGATNGYIRKNNIWVSASAKDEYSYTPSSAHTAVASDYLYVNTQSFIGYSFDWQHAPFNNGNEDYDATYFSSVQNTVCPDNTLALDYDAANANWGNGWRLPSYDELFELCKACNAADVNIHTYKTLDSSIPGKGVYWLNASQTYIPEYTGVAGCLFCDGTNRLFLPACGNGAFHFYSEGTACNYLTRSLRYVRDGDSTEDPDPLWAHVTMFRGMSFDDSYGIAFYSYFRRGENGLSVRPVLN